MLFFIIMFDIAILYRITERYRISEKYFYSHCVHNLQYYLRMKTGKEILNELLEHTKLTKNGLGTLIGLPRSQNLYDIENEKVKNISSELSEKITKVFTEIDRAYLLTGEGSLLLNSEKTKTIFLDQPSDYLLARRNKKNETKEFRVPLVTVKARAGYVTSYDNTDVINSLEKYAVPPGVTYTGAIWRYFEVDGDSMEPVLVTGDYVLCSQVPQDDWENIRNFYVHVLVTDTEVMIKRIFVKETGEWVLISDNETHKQKFFDVSTLKELWVFRRLIKKTISAKKIFKINI